MVAEFVWYSMCYSGKVDWILGLCFTKGCVFTLRNFWIDKCKGSHNIKLMGTSNSKKDFVSLCVT